MMMRFLMFALCSLLLAACSSDNDSGNNTAAPSGLAKAGLDISDVNAETPPDNGQLPGELVPPAE